MSYQANFASHHTSDHHLGFLSARNGIGKCNKMAHYFLFSSYNNTKLQLSDKNISTHTLLKLKIPSWSKSKVQAFFVIFLYTVPYKKETKRRGKILGV